MNGNIISFDTEEWFHTHFFEKYVPLDKWDEQPSRVGIGLNNILRCLKDSNVKATFFVVGVVVERNPEIISLIQEAGHEVGVHGYAHRKITIQSPNEFHDDIGKAREVVEKYSANPVTGYRAPYYTVTPKTYWALDILKDEGFVYDSSIYPLSGHPTYGFPSAPLDPFVLTNGLIEFPMSTVNILRRNIPFGSGSYFRIFPYMFTNYALSLTNRNKRYVTFNMHPWEFDSDQVKIPIKPLNYLRHYFNRRNNLKKLYKLLSDFEFTTFERVIKEGNFTKMELRNGFFRKL